MILVVLFLPPISVTYVCDLLAYFWHPFLSPIFVTYFCHSFQHPFLLPISVQTGPYSD